LHRVRLFFVFLFYIVGLLGYLISPYLLLISLVPFAFLFFYKKEKRSPFYFLFLAMGYLLPLIIPKGNLDITSIDGIVIQQKENYYILLTLSGKYYISSKGNVPPLFSLLHLNGTAKTISETHYESVFSFKNYLKTQGVFHQFNIKDRIDIFLNPISNVPLRNYIFQFLEDKPRLFVTAILCGDSMYSIEENEALSQLGILNALSLSGFHLSFLFHILDLFMPKKRERLLPFIKIGLLSFFLFLSGFRYSIRRILFLEILSQISAKTKFNLTYLERLSITALIFSVMEPYSILSGSFYYPFCLLFPLALFQTKKRKKMEFTLSIYLFYLPFRMSQSPRFYLLSPLLNLIFIPLSHGLFLLSLFLVFIPQIGLLLNPIISLILLISSSMQSIPFYLVTGSPGILFLVFFYGLILITYLAKVYHFKRLIKTCYIATCLTFSTTFIPDFTYHNQVTFVDVGQGDCTLVRYRNYNFMIDTGGNIRKDLAKECLIPYLEKKKIRNLDMVLITHSDYDHSGALESLKSNFQVTLTLTHQDFLSMENTTYDFHGLKIRDYNTFNITSKNDENYQSSVFQFTLKQKSFLIMGDAPKEIENRILSTYPDLRCDVIKIGHHGSNTSSSATFLKAVNPSLAIISVGENNSYGHPHKETIETLTRLSIPYIRTDEVGSYSLNC
jgi:competence protein ComEC